MTRRGIYILSILMLVLTSCIDEAPTVQPKGGTSPISGFDTGTELLQVEGVDPDDLVAVDPIPVDTDFIILFSKPVDQATVIPANITIAPGTPSFTPSFFAGDVASGYKGVRLDLTNGGANPLLFNTTYTVTITTSVLADDGNPLDQVYVYTFTTGIDTSADLDPRVIAVTRYPIGGGMSIDQSSVWVTFSKPVTNVTAATFTINFGAAAGAPYSFDALDPSETWILPLTTPLNYNWTYTVTLDATPGVGIRDGSGNDLFPGAVNSWNFVTELNPFPGGAVTIDSVWITNVTDNTATINWTTNLPVSGSTVDYGTDSSYGDPLSPGNEAAGTYTVHSVAINLTAPSNATKFYYRINSGGATTTGSFITEDNAGASDDDSLSITAGNKSGLVIRQRNTMFNLDGSSFALWIDGSGDVYAQYFDTAGPPNLLWGANGSPVDSNGDKSNIRVFTDFLGRLVVALENGGNIYTKRIYNDAGNNLAFDANWGTAADNDLVDGILIGSGTNPAAVFIWGAQGNNNVDGGFVSRISTGITEMNIPANPFYDFDINLINTPVTGDILYRSNNNQTTVIDSSNFRHVMGQSVSIIAAGNVYMIGDASNTTTFNPTNHSMHSGTVYTNSGQLTYTEHGWPLWGFLSAGDILTQSGNYASIDARTLISVSPIDSGTESTSNRLIDVSANFTGAGVAVNDWVHNTTDDTWAQITTVNSAIELTINSNIMTWGEGYEVLNLPVIASGNSTAESLNQLIDSSADFIAAGVAVNDYVGNTTTSNWAQVTGVVDANTLNLDANIFGAGTLGNSYSIEQRNVLTSGTANRNSRVVDVGALWTSTPVINVDDLVWRTDNSTWAFVLSIVNNRILRLDANIFTGGNRGYEIYRNYCETHELTTPIDDFYEIDVNWNINISTAAGAVTIYDQLKNGTADTPPANPLYDNNADFLLDGVVADDWVYNTTDDTVARVRTAPFAVRTRALDLTSNIMSNADSFTILRFLNPFEPMIERGQTTAGTVGTTLVASGANFTGAGVSAGDLIYNVTADRHAVVASVNSATQLTLNKAVFASGDFFIIFSSDEPLIEAGTVTTDPGGLVFQDANADFISSNVQVGDIVHNNTTGQDGYVVTVAAFGTQLTLNADIMSVGDRYVIMQPRMLYVYERGGSIYGRIIRLRDGTDYQGLGEIDICTDPGTQSNVHVVERGFRGSFNGGSFVVYESGGNIYAKLVDGDGVVPSGAASLGTNIGAGTIIDVISESWDMFYVLYKSGTDVYLRSISNVLGVNWTRTFINADDAAMMLSPSYYITVAYSRGSQVFVQQFRWDNVVMYGESPVVTLTPYAYYSGLSITASPATDGAIVSWVDERYFASLGFVVMAQAVDGLANRLWDADPVGADYDGILIGIPGTWETADVYLKALFYNDAASPWGGLFLWYDYRNGITDIFYDTRNNP
jgi:hypothetical protein